MSDWVLSARLSCALLAALMLSSNNLNASDTNEIASEVARINNLSRVALVAYMYAPYPLSKQSWEIVVAEQEGLLELIEQTARDIDDEQGLLVLQDMAAEIRSGLGIEYFRIFMLEEAYGNPSEAEFLRLLALRYYEPWNDDMEDKETRLRSFVSEHVDRKVGDCCSACEAFADREKYRMSWPEPLVRELPTTSITMDDIDAILLNGYVPDSFNPTPNTSFQRTPTPAARGPLNSDR